MKKRDIFLVFMGSLLISFSYGISFSIPLFIENIGGNEVITGWVLAVYGVGTIIAVLFSKFLFKKIQSKNIASIGTLSYALGSIGFLSVSDVNIVLFIWPVLLGLGWGFYYNSAPYMLSMFSDEENRITLFSYLSAFTVLGSGSAPVLIKKIWGNHINFSFIFSLAFAICILSCIIFNNIMSDTRVKIPDREYIFSSKTDAVILIFGSNVIYPLMMVFLGACVVTVMLNFQTTFANSIMLNYASFFTIYSLAVVGSRFALGKYLSKFNQNYLSIILLILMTFSLLSFQISIYNAFLYEISTVLFAISYGLLYPTIQAIAVNLTSEKYRADTISYFSLLYFIGLYGFPPVAGFLIIHFGYQNTILIISLLSFLELLLGILLCKSNNRKTTVNGRIFCNDGAQE